MVASCPSLCCSCRKNPSQADKQKVGSRSCHLQELLEAGLGCQPFSCRCWQNLMRCRKEICWTCLFKESIPAIPFWEFQVHTFYQKQVPESGSTLHPLCITTVTSCPSHRCSCRKNLSYAEKQRVWSRSCGLEDLLHCSDCALSCAMRQITESCL